VKLLTARAQDHLDRSPFVIEQQPSRSCTFMNLP
jgi:hypothetical protein